MQLTVNIKKKINAVHFGLYLEKFKDIDQKKDYNAYHFHI